MTAPHPFVWRVTPRASLAAGFTHEISGEAVHITNSGDLFITGPAPLFLTLFALARELSTAFTHGPRIDPDGPN